MSPPDQAGEPFDRTRGEELAEPPGSHASDAHMHARIERIARRAYELYARRGGEQGRELQDWLDAEREIDDEDGKTPRAE